MSAWISRPDLDELIGPEAAEQLCRDHGGVPFYIPRNVKQGQGLAAKIGFGCAHALSCMFGGEYVTIPLGSRRTLKSRILTLLDEGKSAPAIARELGTTERYVRKIMAMHRAPREWLMMI